MIVCEHCESAEFLNITDSQVRISPDGQLKEVEESIECTRCELTGVYENDGEEESVSGGIVVTDERPLTAPANRSGGAA